MDLKNRFCKGLHGGGEICGFQKTNSKEAFQYWYSKGYRFFEFDVSETADGKFVAFAHRLNDGYLFQVELRKPMGECTSEWFSTQKLYPYSTKGLSTLSMDEIFDTMRKDSSMLLMIDLFAASDDEISRFAKYLSNVIGRDNGLVFRCLVEVYELTDSTIIHKEVPNISLIYGVQPGSDLWPLPLSDGFNEEVLKQIKECGISFISYQWHYRNDYSDGIKILKNHGFFILSHIDSDLNAEEVRKEGVNIILADYCYGERQGLVNRILVLLIRKKAKIAFFINKVRRIGLRVIVRKALKRIV